MTQVLVMNLHQKKKVNLKSIKNLSQKILSKEKNRQNLNIILTDDKYIIRLNRKFSRRNRSTDVLSFGMQEGEKMIPPSDVLGEIYISLDRAEKQAKEKAKKEKELAKIEAKESKEREKRAAKEAGKQDKHKLKVDKKAIGITKEKVKLAEGSYKDIVKLVVAPPVDYKRLREAQEQISHSNALILLMVGGSVEEGTTIHLSLKEPLSLAEELKAMPAIEEVFEEKKQFWVKLTS